MIEILSEILRFLVSVLQQLNSLLLNYFGGVLLAIATIAALAAYRKSSKLQENQNTMQRLADAIIRQHNRELRENK